MVACNKKLLRVIRYRIIWLRITYTFTSDHQTSYLEEVEYDALSILRGPVMRGKHVIGPDGHFLTVADLPSPETKRWVIRRKAQVVAAVRGGLLSLEQACSRYALNFEEFRSWERSIDRFGVKGLRTTRTQFYLHAQTRPGSFRTLRTRY
jgi:Protein of unknown function (DUF1153)